MLQEFTGVTGFVRPLCRLKSEAPLHPREQSLYSILYAHESDVAWRIHSLVMIGSTKFVSTHFPEYCRFGLSLAGCSRCRDDALSSLRSAACEIIRVFVAWKGKPGLEARSGNERSGFEIIDVLIWDMKAAWL